MYEIVAVRIGSIITNDLKVITGVLKSKQHFEPLTRTRMQLMAACDVGEHWKRLAEGPTLWRVDSDGNIVDESKTSEGITKAVSDVVY